MDSNSFLELLKHSGQLEELDYLQLQDVRQRYPYFHLAHGLTAKFEFEKNGRKHGDSLAIAALTSPDRQALKRWIESPGNTPPSVSREARFDDSSSQNKSVPENLSLEENRGSVITGMEGSLDPDKPEKKRRSLPKDDLIESIKKKEKREIVDSKKKEQIDLIREFNKKDFKMAAIKEIEANQPTENLADASTRLNDNLVSETFARILVRQGKNETAIEIYEKLALKFPDKRAYFADLIEKLKE